MTTIARSSDCGSAVAAVSAASAIAVKVRADRSFSFFLHSRQALFRRDWLILPVVQSPVHVKVEAVIEHHRLRRRSCVICGWFVVYFSSSTERIFPAGSLNHAIVGPCGPRAMPRSSVLMSGRL